MNTEKVERAISYLRNFEPKTEPYYVCYSGGKDSDAIRILCDLAGVNYELHNNHTTVDAPETVMYIRKVMEQYGEKRIEHDPKDGRKIYRYGERGFIHLPLKTMWDLIIENNFPPTRIARFCCEELKEKGGKGRRKVTGVRWAESANRRKNSGLVIIQGKKKTVEDIAEKENADFFRSAKGGLILNTDNDASRRVVESCYRTASTLINPIINWSDSDVWDFLRENGCESNPLYKEGFTRIGCIGCPMGMRKNMMRQFYRWPTYKNAYIRAFSHIRGNSKATGEEWFSWWTQEEIFPGQMKLELEEDADE